MKKIYKLLFVVAGTSLLCGGAYADPTWPPAGCLNADEVREFRDNNPSSVAYLGLYSGDDSATNNGNIFWLGSANGSNVLPPNTPTRVPQTPQGEGFLLRWNISDTVMIGNNQANQQVSSHYAWDYDKARDGDYAVNAIAINKCTQNGDGFTCEQALFGESAWKGDHATGDFELCPPVILPEDASSIYVYDLNDNSETEEYEYSLALTLKAGGQKSGLRVIIDPKVTNGGVGQR